MDQWTVGFLMGLGVGAVLVLAGCALKWLIELGVERDRRESYENALLKARLAKAQGFPWIPQPDTDDSLVQAIRDRLTLDSITAQEARNRQTKKSPDEGQLAVERVVAESMKRSA